MTSPVFRTTYVYVIVSPTLPYVIGAAVFVSVSAGVCGMVVSVVSVSQVVPSEAQAVAALWTEPVSRSAWVTVWEPEQVVFAPGARSAAPQG